MGLSRGSGGSGVEWFWRWGWRERRRRIKDCPASVGATMVPIRATREGLQVPTPRPPLLNRLDLPTPSPAPHSRVNPPAAPATELPDSLPPPQLGLCCCFCFHCSVACALRRSFASPAVVPTTTFQHNLILPPISTPSRSPRFCCLFPYPRGRHCRPCPFLNRRNGDRQGTRGRRPRLPAPKNGSKIGPVTSSVEHMGLSHGIVQG